MTAHDENRNPWLVLKGDPAYPLCSLLERRGFPRITLPRKAIITGTVEKEQVPRVGSISTLADTLGSVGSLGQTFLDYMDLYDCTSYLVDSQPPS